MLWNAAEKRKDAQVARKIVLALPADRKRKPLATVDAVFEWAWNSVMLG